MSCGRVGTTFITQMGDLCNGDTLPLFFLSRIYVCKFINSQNCHPIGRGRGRKGYYLIQFSFAEAVDFYPFPARNSEIENMEYLKEHKNPC